MKPNFSIIATLIEAARLGIRHRGLVIVLAVIAVLPALALLPVVASLAPDPHPLSTVDSGKNIDAQLAEMERAASDAERKALEATGLSLR